MTNYLMKLKTGRRSRSSAWTCEPDRERSRLLLPRPVSWSISSMRCAWPNACPERECARTSEGAETVPEPDSQGRPENPAETRSRSSQIGAPHHGDLDRRVPELLAAYEHKERFYGIWHATTRLQAEAALDQWIATIPRAEGSLERTWSGQWETGARDHDVLLMDMPVTNAYTESINRLAKDKNREGRGYSFEVMRARMLYTTKHKKKAPTAKVSPFYKKTIGYGLPDSQRN